MDKFKTFIFIILGINFVVFMWLLLKNTVGSAWYSWIDPVMIALIILMVITGTLAILTSKKTVK